MSEKDDYVKFEVKIDAAGLSPYEPSEELKEEFAERLRPLIGEEFVTTHLEFVERGGRVREIRLRLAPVLSRRGNRGGQK